MGNYIDIDTAVVVDVGVGVVDKAAAAAAAAADKVPAAVVDVAVLTALTTLLPF